MRRPVRTLSFAALLGAASFVPSLRLANAGPATDDNDELVADPEFTGLPDKDSHSGVFLDIIAAGSSSIVQDSYYRVVTEPATASLKVLVFDGNCGGLWDQNLIQHGAGSAVLPDGSVVEYDLMTDSPDFPRTVVALGESESATPRPGAKVFSYAVDSRWEFLYDGPNHPSSTVLATGEHQYVLHVKYRLPTPSGAAVAPINGFKLAANGVLGQSPNAGETLLGGFIGGVVDSRNLLFALPGAPAAGSEYSVSRDHYPDALEPAASLNGLLLNGAAYAPAVRYPAPDAYENRYAGSFDIRVRLVPKPGESWAQFLASLILEEGDADDVDDASGVGPDGMPSPSIAGVPPDDGRFYVDTSGRQHDNSGYRLPVAAAPADAGSPWLELIDPNGVVRVTLFDLSGNVSQEDATGNAFERIPVPADGVPGLWTLRMHHLDARNSWFLRTNAETRADRQSLEGRVFCDLDGDTTDDLDTDPGIAGVVVTIQRTDVAGVPPILRTTDATGAWRVETIAAGTYAVSVTDGQAPIGAKKKTTTQPVPATVAPSQNVRDVDLGYLPSGAVGDRVWCDEDGDKAQDPGEPGLDGVTVELYRLDPQGPVLLGTRATAGGGVYLFDNLPDAIYRAVVRTDTVPGKKTPTTETTCDATITGGGSELGCDFGFRPVGALGDRVWEDRDGDGTQGPPATEPGLNGVVVELLDATGTVVLRTTTTTGDGGYLFEGLADGEYRVRVAEASVPPGYARTTPATNPRAASVVDGSVDLTVDFGYRATGRLGDRVWCDEDGDQVQDPEEPGLVGVTVELYRVVAGVPTFLATQTTGTNGAYLFDALPDGTYRAVVLPATVPGAKEPTTETTCEEAIVAGSSALGCDFGFRPAGALGDRVWHDCDRDGVQDADEPGFDGVVVRLYLVTPQAPVLVRTTTTANDGHYLFDHLDDGAYLVEVDESALRPTMFRSWPALNPLPSAVVDGSKDLTRDFGYCFLGAIGDRVWLDRDGDGLQDLPADEPGIDGAVVRLYEVTPAGPVLVGTKTTAGGGLYLFDNLPDATYRVEVDESGLPGLARTAPAANPTTAVIAGGERRFDVDFGYRPRGAIGDRVWLDVDGDAVQDAPADEPGLDGVTVLLLRRQGDVLSIVATKTTAGGGLYRFDGLDDGEYLVTVDDTTLPKAVVRTFPATVPATATITNGSEDLTKDFGYRPSDECDPGDDPRLSKLCLEASVWLADPTTTTFDVYVRLDRGEQPGRLVDLACVGFDGPLPGPVAGRNGVLTITGFRVEDGYAKVTVCLDAHTAAFPGGSFAGTHRLEVVVNGVGEAAADRLEAPPLVRGGTFPHDWAPLWCDDLPDFRVVSWTWFACDPDKPCTDGCVKPRTWWVTVSSHGACDATRVPWPMPRAEDRRLCGATWLQILERAPTRATAWTLLAQAWIVAQLNAADGACVSPAVAAAIEEAGALLGQTCDCLCGCATGRAGELTQLLDAFNSGGAGPKPCTEPLPCCPKPPKPSKPSAPKSVARGR